LTHTAAQPFNNSAVLIDRGIFWRSGRGHSKYILRDHFMFSLIINTTLQQVMPGSQDECTSKRNPADTRGPSVGEGSQPKQGHPTAG